jgi:hypothetical protein
MLRVVMLIFVMLNVIFLTANMLNVSASAIVHVTIANFCLSVLFENKIVLIKLLVALH